MTNTINDTKDIKIRLRKMYFSTASVLLFNNLTFFIVNSIAINNNVNVAVSIQLVYPLNILFSFFTLFIFQGHFVQISTSVGKKNYDEASKIVGSALFLNIVFFAIFNIIIYFSLDNILLFYTKDLEIIENSKKLIIPYIFLSPLVIIYSFIGPNILKLEGKNKIHNVSVILLCVSWVLLNYFFIIVLNLDFWGIPISYFLNVIIGNIYYIILNKKLKLNIQFKLKYIKFNKNYILNSLKYSYAVAILLIGTTSYIFILNKLLSSNLNVQQMIAFSVAYISLNSIVAIANLIGISSAPLFSIFSAENNKFKVKQLLQISYKWAMCIQICLLIFIFLFSDLIISISLSRNEEYFSFASTVFKLFCLSTIFIPITSINVNYFLFTLKPHISSSIQLFRYFIIMPISFYILPLLFDTKGIFFVDISMQIFTMILSVLFILKYNKKEEFKND